MVIKELIIVWRIPANNEKKEIEKTKMKNEDENDQNINEIKLKRNENLMTDGSENFFDRNEIGPPWTNENNKPT